MQTSNKVDWLAEQEMMAGLVKLFKEREVNGIVKINIAVCNWQNEGFVTNEDWDITMKYGALISICRKVQNQADRMYEYGESPKGCGGIFYWYHPQLPNHHCERIRLFLSTNENDCYLTGEVWVCLNPGPYQGENSDGENLMTFRWP